MKHRVLFSPRSLRDLKGIRSWVIAEAGNAAVADRFMDRLLQACQSLETLPMRYPPYPFARAWRMMPCDSYLVFYQIAGGEVKIGHIRHAARRPMRG